MNDIETRFLFVYGTLRKGIGHPMAEFLAQRARFLGAARTAGRLYDLGPYPGMREAESATEWVHGDLFELDDVSDTLAALDRYERQGRGRPLFVRRTAEAIAPSGERVTAWVYLYEGPLREARLIASGEYRELPRRRGRRLGKRRI